MSQGINFREELRNIVIAAAITLAYRLLAAPAPGCDTSASAQTIHALEVLILGSFIMLPMVYIHNVAIVRWWCGAERDEVKVVEFFLLLFLSFISIYIVIILIMSSELGTIIAFGANYFAAYYAFHGERRTIKIV